MRMIRVGKWTGKPSKKAAAQVSVLLERYFLTEKVWHRTEHGAVVVAVRENIDNTAIVEEFRFNRPMESRFVFTERKDGGVDVELKPLEVT